MAGMILNYTFRDDALIQLDGPDVVYWPGMGKPEFMGKLNDYAEIYPARITELVAEGIITAK